jgi:hypothetical protein
MEPCDNRPEGTFWPVCSLEVGHDGVHESADFWWRACETEPHVKGRP